ncbi:MAG: hypothetical protein JSV89_00725 [Spirochaetaceae bacterium]|nr:MAG: hypothetical protein JSV89_00725 [Spirochaetaceae bacterium]
MKKLPYLLLLVVLLVSCASIQRSKDEGNVERISELINTGQADALDAMSELPFLLDQEIIVLAKDVQTFWSTIVDVGFKVEAPMLERGVKIGPDSYKEFYDSMEVQTFFKKYLKKQSRLLELKTNTGQTILLLVTDTLFTRTIHGFKGPY